MFPLMGKSKSLAIGRINNISVNHYVYFSYFFLLVLLAISRKSTNFRKYHLLEKRNPFYFLAYFCYFSANFFTFQLTFYIIFTYTLLFSYFYMYFTSLLFLQTWQVKKKVEGITFSTCGQKGRKSRQKVQKVNIGFY